MLIRLRVSNFRSLRDEQELSMVAALRDNREDLVHVEGLGLDLVRSAGIYGANAAGKSNVLLALSFMQDAVMESHRVWKPDGPIPRQPFRLGPKGRSEPSLFEADFLIDNIRYKYGFKVDSRKVLNEWLYAYPNKRQQVWFTRDSQSSQPFAFGKQLKGSNRTIESLTRNNSLFLSVAAENNHPSLSPIYSWFSENLSFANANHFSRASRTEFTLKMVEQENRKSAILNLLKLADLGIIEIKVRENPLAKRFAKALEEIRKTSSSEGDLQVEFSPIAELRHRSREGSTAISFEDESQGTQAWLSLTGPLLHVLESGTLLCVDELDASLHPHLASEVIRMFQDPVRNPRNAQLIFNTHDTTLLGNLLDGPSLHRDQVWFVEKDDEGATHLYPLTDFRPRKSENLERGYLQGRYGAIPFIEPVLMGQDVK